MNKMYRFISELVDVISKDEPLDCYLRKPGGEPEKEIKDLEDKQIPSEDEKKKETEGVPLEKA